MDNRSIDITSMGDTDIAHAVSIVWGHPSRRASHYRIVKLKEETKYLGSPEVNHHYTTYSVDKEEGRDTLILYWHEDKDNLLLPFSLDLAGSIQFIQDWLRTSADYSQAPNIDGSSSKGWRMFTDYWGHVAGSHYGIVGVQPRWAMHGK